MQFPVIFFEVLMADLESIRFSRRWGSSFSPWFDAITPSRTIQFYSPTSAEATIKISDGDGNVFNQLIAEVDMGINSVKYDLSVSAKGVKSMKKKGVELKEQENGIYYLPKGNYTISVAVNGKANSTTLEIK